MLGTGISHSEVKVELDYVVIDSWDAEDALVYVDDVEQYRQTFIHSAATTRTCGSSWAEHGPQPVSIQASHTASEVTVRATSTLNSGAIDESFGIDNVFVWIR